VPAGTLCITIAANIGKTGILGFDACFPDSVVGFTPSWRVTVEYVQGWLATQQTELERVAPAAAQRNINLKILRNLVLPIPPLDLQRDYSAKVAEIRGLRGLQSQSATRLAALFRSLLRAGTAGAL
jgi:type I restriction enzyme S subunit